MSVVWNNNSQMQRTPIQLRTELAHAESRIMKLETQLREAEWSTQYLERMMIGRNNQPYIQIDATAPRILVDGKIYAKMVE